MSVAEYETMMWLWQCIKMVFISDSFMDTEHKVKQKRVFNLRKNVWTTFACQLRTVKSAQVNRGITWVILYQNTVNTVN